MEIAMTAKSFDVLSHAQRHVIELGYSKFHEYSESGDYGPRSREYWAKPSSPVNEHGIPMERVAISYVMGQWRVMS